MRQLAGRLRDLDSHLLVPPDHLRESIGPLGRVAGDLMRRDPRVRTALESGEEDVAPETVWDTKGYAAPGAFDLDRRVAALDVMGIERQLVLPAVMIALAVWAPPGSRRPCRASLQPVRGRVGRAAS